MRTIHSRPLRMGAALFALLAAVSCSKSPQPASAAAPTAASTACDRQCLIDATNAYVAALVAHDVSRAPLNSPTGWE